MRTVRTCNDTQRRDTEDILCFNCDNSVNPKGDQEIQIKESGHKL